MSILSDLEFLLNHSALINPEGDHKSMLLLDPETYRVGLSEIGAEGQKVQKSKLVTFFLL